MNLSFARIADKTGQPVPQVRDALARASSGAVDYRNGHIADPVVEQIAKVLGGPAQLEQALVYLR